MQEFIDSLFSHAVFPLISNPTRLTSYSATLIDIIIHQTHYEKSNWSRAINQFTIACELDMINAISAAPWSVLLRNRMAEPERFASVSKDEFFRITEEKDSKNTK